MNATIYVDNLAATTTEDELTELFSQFGSVAHINIAVDPIDDTPCCFGFVTMATPEAARMAIQTLNGKTNGISASFSVSEASPPQQRAFRRRNGLSPRRVASTLF